MRKDASGRIWSCPRLAHTEEPRITKLIFLYDYCRLLVLSEPAELSNAAGDRRGPFRELDLCH